MEVALNICYDVIVRLNVTIRKWKLLSFEILIFSEQKYVLYMKYKINLPPDSVHIFLSVR